MSASAQLKNFLHHTLFSKFKVKLTIQQFNQILSEAQRLTKISDQGLILIALVEQLQRQATLNYSAIKKLIAELQATQKKQKPKRSKNQDDSRPIQRRRKPKDVSNQGLDLDNLAQQSVSNPSNLQRQRQNIQHRIANSGIIDDNSNPNSKQQSKGSKDSKDSQKQIAYKERLNKITEQLQIPPDTYLTNDNNQNHIGLQIPDSQTESSNSFGLISNLNEKMKIFDYQKKDDQTRTKKKNDRLIRATATKKIGNLNITIDEKLSIEQTRISLNDTFSLNQTKTKPSFEDMHMIDKYQRYSQTLDSTCSYQRLLTQFFLQKVSQVLVQSKSESTNNYYNFPEQDLTNYQSYQPQYNNEFTSQQTGNFGNLSSQDVNLIHSEINNLSLDVKQKIGLSDLSLKLQKNKSQLFYEMLKLAQNGDIVLEQLAPEDFSQIFVSSISKK